jgi:hypothetical protein
MKKMLAIVALSAAALVSTNMASASVYSNHRGENACLFQLVNLKNHGFAEHNAYTSEQIHQLLNSSDIQAKNVDTLVPGQSYQLVYSCYVDHQLARATLQALPINNPNHVVTNITWQATKPVQ